MPKKRKLTRKERKAQRDAELQRRGIERRAAPARSEIISDIQPLFALAGDSPEGVSVLMDIVTGSDDLAGEPELESIFVAPLECVGAFIRTAEKMGYMPEALNALPEEEADEANAEILSSMMQQILTRDVRRQILDGLDRLRLRLKQQGRTEQTARVAAVLSFLDMNRGGRGWEAVGVVGKIVHRSLAIGWELVGAAMESESSGEETLDILSQMQSPQVSAKTESLVERVPGLRAYLEGEVDKIWDAGVEAVGSGELDLGLFSTDELDAWPDILEAAGALQRGDPSGGDEEVAEPIINAETGPRIVAQIGTYLTGLLKGDRLAQLQSQLEILSHESALPLAHQAFVRVLARTLDGEDAVEHEMSFLIRTFFKELMAYQAEDAAEEDDPAG